MWKTDRFKEFISKYSDYDSDYYAIHAIINAEQNSYWTLKVLTLHSHRTQSVWFSFGKSIKSEVENSDWGGKSELIQRSVPVSSIQSRPLTPPLVAVFISIMSQVWSVYEPGESVGRENSQTLQRKMTAHSVKFTSAVWFHFTGYQRQRQAKLFCCQRELMKVAQKGIHKNILLSDRELYN